MPLWTRVRSGLVESIYPKTCAGCGMRGTWLCDACLHSIPRLEMGICFRCGAPFRPACRSCAQLDRAIHQARSAFPYLGWVSTAVRSFKYADERSRAEHLAGLMFPMLDIMGTFDAIVPVPLHAEKLRRRGYNQALLLATAIGLHLDVPVQPLLVRTRDTPSQVELSRDERLTNLTGAFNLNPDWVPAPGARFLLVDDVRTTGSTLNACANQLVRTGPRRIAAATLALDLPPRELGEWLDEYRS